MSDGCLGEISSGFILIVSMVSGECLGRVSEVSCMCLASVRVSVSVMLVFCWCFYVCILGTLPLSCHRVVTGLSLGCFQVGWGLSKCYLWVFVVLKECRLLFISGFFGVVLGCIWIVLGIFQVFFGLYLCLAAMHQAS